MSLPYGFVICQMLFYEMQVIIVTFSMIFRILMSCLIHAKVVPSDSLVKLVCKGTMPFIFRCAS